MTIDQTLDSIIDLYETEHETAVEEYLDTGFEELNKIIKGYPKGRIVEIFGGEASAKTYLVLKAIEKVHLLGGFVIYYDTDHTFSESYIESFDINKDMMIIMRPKHGEDIIDSMHRIIRTGAVSLFIIDSITSIIPKCDTGEPFAHIKYVTNLTKVLSQTIGSNGCYCIFTNQIRESKQGLVSTGGKILKDYSYIRINTSRANKFLMMGDEKIGEKINVKIIKNKMAENKEDIYSHKTVKINILYT